MTCLVHFLNVVDLWYCSDFHSNTQNNLVIVHHIQCLCLCSNDILLRLFCDERKRERERTKKKHHQCEMLIKIYTVCVHNFALLVLYIVLHYNVSAASALTWHFGIWKFEMFKTHSTHATK